MPKKHVVEASSSQEIVSGQRSPSKKRKHKEVVSSTELDTTFSQDDEITFKPSQTEINDTQWTEADKEIHIWTVKHINQLMNNMEEAIMKLDDGTRTCTGLEKAINWDEVKFGRFSVYECKMMWHRIQKKVKRHRTVSEFYNAAKQVLDQDPKFFIRNQKRYTAEELYVEKKLDDFIEANPETPMQQAIEELKVKYENLSDKRKAKYEEKSTAVKKKITKSSSNKCPKPPQPVDFYIESKLPSVMEKKPELSEFQAINYCRHKYKKLKESKQIKYINKCIDHFPSYQEEVIEYLSENPEKEVKMASNYINKNEMATKWKHDGIPHKPPGTGYSIFAQNIMKDEEFTQNNPVTEYFKIISERWKEVPLEEKQKYNEESHKLKEAYKTEMKEKLLSLPEEERELLTKTVNLPTLESLEPSTKKKKTKLITDFWKPKLKEDILPATFPGEPKHKIVNSYAHFVQEHIPTLSGHRGSDKLKILGERWRQMAEEEKVKYLEKAKECEAQYQEELAKFKESLSKKDLARYEEIVKNRSKKKSSKSKTNSTITSNKKADVHEEADGASEVENGTGDEDSD
ncbi:hypothetical protein LOTGIDRAFT_235792 [Lottia gigantea]|uniref:HMG box domain-containing protein n=1 Tax=Lottia gigantea TaxID=225164 RepID=V3ZWE5_LOTGI|nr:hypothetical protein LOTGIDRAFT_235792 [Lottia gigantea]ESO85281.1 hypothetical protein LOTGIDRAFT_235792 [Lottia gigantea]